MCVCVRACVRAWFLSPYVCGFCPRVCVCVYVCVCEREREREVCVCVGGEYVYVHVRVCGWVCVWMLSVTEVCVVGWV